MNWMDARVRESAGFVSRRIAERILFLHEILYGESFHINYGIFKRVLLPWEVRVKP